MAAKVTIDLLPQHLIEERRLTRFLNWSLTYGRYIIIVTELIVLLAFFSRFRLDQQLTDLHESISQKQAIIASVAQFEHEARQVHDRIDKIRELNKEHTLFLDAISLLEGLVPDDVILSQLNFSQNKVELTGTSFSRGGFSRLVQNLKNEKKIRAVSVDAVAKPKEGGILTFTINFELAKLVL